MDTAIWVDRHHHINIMDGLGWIDLINSAKHCKIRIGESNISRIHFFCFFFKINSGCWAINMYIEKYIAVKYIHI